MEDDEWEVCNLWHDVKHGKGKHEIRLSIHKECDYRLTFCRVCGHSVKFYRKPAEGTEQANQPDSGE